MIAAMNWYRRLMVSLQHWPWMATLKTLRLDSKGHIHDPGRHWFAVLRHQASVPN